MYNVIAGDTIILEANLRDQNGTAVTTAIGSVTVVDASGSTVLATNATHVASGTHQRSGVSTTGWAVGPITEYWKFTASAGTLNQVVTNGFRVIATNTVRPYINVDELKQYYENAEDFFDGNQEAEVVNAYNEVNARLEALNIKLPILARVSDGLFDQPLRDLNAYEALYRLIGKRQTSYRRDGEEDPWFYHFKEMSGSIYKNIEKKTYAFSRDYSAQEGGISLATKTVGTSQIQMETNWRGGVGNGFTDSTYDRTWIVKITGTGTAGEIGEGTMIWSKDGGITYSGTLNTSLDWQELYYGAYVRFHLGTYTAGTTALMAVNDKWQFTTAPRSQAQGGPRTAISY